MPTTHEPQQSRLHRQQDPDRRYRAGDLVRWMVSITVVSLICLGTVGNATAASSEFEVDHLLAVDLVGNELVVAAATTTRLVDPLAVPFQLDEDDLEPDTASSPTAGVWLLRGAGHELGWSTARLNGDAFDSEVVHASARLVEGPGTVALTFTASSGTDQVMASPDEPSAAVALPTGVEGTMNMAFAEAGSYLVEITITATTSFGPELDASAQYRIDVIDPSSDVPTTTSTTSAPTAEETTTTTTTPTETERGATGVIPSQTQTSASRRIPTVVDSPDVVLDDVHVDLAALLVDGALQIVVKDGTSSSDPVYRDPRSVTLHVKPSARIDIPDAPAFAFLGEPGGRSFVLPQVQDPNLLWPGWNTESLSTTDVSGSVTWRLHGVEGPGDFAIFVSDAFGSPTVLFDSATSLPNTTTVPLGTHAHGNWAFSTQGRYELDFEMSAQLASGAVVSTRETVVFTVGSGSSDTGSDGDDTDDKAEDGENSDDGATDRETTDDGKLPLTGLDALGPMAIIGGGLLAFGVLVVAAGGRGRRRDS